jgi:hypothetical protein
LEHDLLLSQAGQNSARIDLLEEVVLGRTVGNQVGVTRLGKNNDQLLDATGAARRRRRGWSKERSPLLWTGANVRQSVHGPKTDFSNAFTPLHQDSCPWPLSFAHVTEALEGAAPVFSAGAN